MAAMATMTMTVRLRKTSGPARGSQAQPQRMAEKRPRVRVALRRRCWLEAWARRPRATAMEIAPAATARRGSWLARSWMAKKEMRKTRIDWMKVARPSHPGDWLGQFSRGGIERDSENIASGARNMEVEVGTTEMGGVRRR